MADDETFSGTVKAEVQITPPAESESKPAAKPADETSTTARPATEKKPQAETEQGSHTVTPDDDPGIASVEPEMPPMGPPGPDGIPINPVDGNPIAPGYAKPFVDEDGNPVSPGVAITEEDDEGAVTLKSPESESRSVNAARSEMPEPERPEPAEDEDEPKNESETKPAKEDA